MDEMKAGRELDCAVAERVMGENNQDIDQMGRQYTMYEYRPYSTDIAAAWEVVDCLRSKQWPREGGTDTLTGLQISFRKDGIEVRLMDQFDNTWEMEQSASLPLAIALAALKAVGR